MVTVIKSNMELKLDDTVPNEEIEIKKEHVKKRHYNQRYHEEWEDDPQLRGWLVASEKGPYYSFCKVCMKHFGSGSGKSDALRHGRGIKHMKRFEEFKNNPPITVQWTVDGESQTHTVEVSPNNNNAMEIDEASFTVTSQQDDSKENITIQAQPSSSSNLHTSRSTSSIKTKTKRTYIKTEKVIIAVPYYYYQMIS